MRLQECAAKFPGQVEAWDEMDGVKKIKCPSVLFAETRERERLKHKMDRYVQTSFSGDTISKEGLI